MIIIYLILQHSELLVIMNPDTLGNVFSEMASCLSLADTSVFVFQFR